ncbi:unnamed protein product, partial [Pocillopora meandrina]
GDLTYNSVLECLSIDTGNEIRPPSITVTSCDDGSRMLTHLGCLSSHNFHFNDSLWNYQVARFKFDGNIVITNLVHLRGTNALSLTGENITIDLNGVLKVDVNTVPSSHKETRLVGGFVSAIGANGNPYGGPGRGLYYKKEAGGAGHGGHGGHGEGKRKYSYSKPYGLKNVDHYLGGSTGAFTGSNTPGFGGPAIELNATGKIEIRGAIEASAISNPVLSGISSNEKIGGNSGGLVRLIAETVHISHEARIYVNGSKGICSGNNCKAGGGSGGIVQIISSCGSIAPNAIFLRGSQAEDGFLYIKGISEGNFQTFPDDPYSWGQKSSSTRTLTSGARITIPASTSPRHSSSEITTVNSAISTATFHTTSKVFTSCELDTTTSYAQDISTRTSHQTSPVRIASSSSLQPPHPTESTISVPPFKKGTVEDLQNLLEKVKTYKENKVNTSNPVEAITQFLESFRTFTVVGNLTTYIINISISLIVELNELMLSDRHHKLQLISALLNTVDELLDDKNAAVWRSSGMLMDLVEAVEKTALLAINYTSATNQSVMLIKKNLEMHSIVQYVNPNSNVTIPNSNKQSRSTALITLQASGLSMNISRYTKEGRLAVSMVIYKNQISYFTSRTPSAAIDGGGEWSSNGLSLIKSDSESTDCSTNHLTSFAVIMSFTEVDVSPKDQFALGIITYIGCSISLVSLASAIMIFLYLRSLTDIRYKIHLHLCIALAMAQVVFLVGITATERKWLCTLVAVLLHYLYTASFAWMSAEGLHLYFKIVAVFNLQNLKFIYYAVFGWGEYILTILEEIVGRVDLYGLLKMCWLSLDKGLIWSFVGPVAAIILFNLSMLGMTIKVLVSLTDVAESNVQKNSLRSCIKAALILMPLLGISWIFGLLSVNSGTIAFQYLFAIMNSSQGLFIFICHCIGNAEVRAALIRSKKRHSVKVSTQNRCSRQISLDKMKTKSKVLKQSADQKNPKTDIVKVEGSQ